MQPKDWNHPDRMRTGEQLCIRCCSLAAEKKRGVNPIIADDWRPRKPDKPIEYRPGSVERIRAYQERAERGEELFDKRDATFDGAIGCRTTRAVLDV